MRQIMLTGALIASVGTAAAVEVGLEVQPDGLTAERWQQQQAERFRALRSAIGTLPRTAAAIVDLTEADIAGIHDRNRRAPAGRPLEVGIVKPLGLAFDLSGLQSTLAAGDPVSYLDGSARLTDGSALVWTVRIDMENTGGVRLHLTDVNLPDGASLSLYNAEGEVRGPYVGNAESLWTHSLSGGEVYLQLTQPDQAGGARVSFRLSEALLLDPSPQAFCPDNEPCVEDGSCYDSTDWPMIEQARKAIANILFVEGGTGYICTGGLLNDTDTETTIPYFLTANHCLSSNTVASTVETRFQFQTATCGGACYWPSSPSTRGANLLSTDSSNDHTLLRLDEQPPAGSVYLGWTTTAVAGSNGTQLYRLSHPKGSPQAYSTHAVDVSAPTCIGYARGRFIYSRNQVGATEGGSSGSPVMNVSGKVVGQLFGACGKNVQDPCDSENNATVDGAFADYFDDVSPWLDPGSDPGTCPSSALVARQPDAQGWLGLLYAFRDQVLPQTAAGDWMRAAYERHGAEVTQQLILNRPLRRQAMAVLMAVRPALEAATRDGKIALTQSELKAVQAFTAALRQEASDALAQDLDQFSSLLLSAP